MFLQYVCLKQCKKTKTNLSRLSESGDHRYLKNYHLDCHLLNHTIQEKYQ